MPNTINGRLIATVDEILSFWGEQSWGEGFGVPPDGAIRQLWHAGLDVAGGRGGLMIPCPVWGVVIAKGNYGAYGNVIIVRSVRSGVILVFCHMQDPATQKVGDWIEQWEIVGRVGSTGNSTGPHLHLQVGPETEACVANPGYRNGIATDPWIEPTALITAAINGQQWRGTYLCKPQDDPKPPAPRPIPKTARQVRADSAPLRRSDTNTKTSTVYGAWPSGAIVEMKGWLTGESVEGNNIWFLDAGDTYTHSSSYTDMGTHDLRDVTPPKPAPEPDPAGQVEDLLVSANGSIDQALAIIREKYLS